MRRADGRLTSGFVGAPGLGRVAREPPPDILMSGKEELCLDQPDF